MHLCTRILSTTFTVDFGDVVMEGPNKASVAVAPEAVNKVTCLRLVGSIPVDISLVELSTLPFRRPVTKEMTTVEASLRLDAIASAGFGLRCNNGRRALSFLRCFIEFCNFQAFELIGVVLRNVPMKECFFILLSNISLCSRSKLVSLLDAGQVMLDWREISKAYSLQVQ